MKGGYLRTMEGEKTWVTFRYERLPTICLACGRIGHDVRHCEVSIDSQPKEHQYGDWIRANGSHKELSEKMKAGKGQATCLTTMVKESNHHRKGR